MNPFDNFPVFDNNDPAHNKDWSEIMHWYGDKRHFRPWYDDDADYNTNAKSYYDWLGRFIAQLDNMIKLMNLLLARDVEVQDTTTIDLTKSGDWQHYDCETGQYDIIETFKADLIVSKQALNAVQVLSDGVYVKDLQPQIDNINNKIDNINNKIENITNRVDKIENAFTKLLQNLKDSGMWIQDGDTIFDGHFAPQMYLAWGNINLYGGTPDGGSFIKTNNKQSENDLAAGI